MDQQYLQPANQLVAAEFVNGLLWDDFRRCLLARRPPMPDVKDDAHVAAAKGHQRAGYELALAELEKIPFEQGESQASPWDRPAVAITQD